MTPTGEDSNRAPVNGLNCEDPVAVYDLSGPSAHRSKMANQLSTEGKYGKRPCHFPLAKSTRHHIIHALFGRF